LQTGDIIKIGRIKLKIREIKLDCSLDDSEKNIKNGEAKETPVDSDDNNENNQ
jgi:hypothetical protein